MRPSKKSLHDVNTQEIVPVPVPRPRKSLSATTTEVSPPLSNTATSDDQQLPPITPLATRSPAKHVTEATRDTRMNSHEAPAESSTNSAIKDSVVIDNLSQEYVFLFDDVSVSLICNIM